MKLKFNKIMITGHPGSGKSSLAELLNQKYQCVLSFDFGNELLKTLKNRGINITYEDLRGYSATILTADDIKKTDEKLLELSNTIPNNKLLIIDSHAVTKESFGNRVTMSEKNMLSELDIKAIILIEANYQLYRKRVGLKTDGRIIMSENEYYSCQMLQQSVATIYSFYINSPLYALDNNDSLKNLMTKVEKIIFTH